MPKVAVAIPVKDEAERIVACLTAIARQEAAPTPLVVLLINNSTDGTARIARRCASRLSLNVDMREISLSPERANAGTARSLAMARAASLAGPDGVLLTTDADGCVPPDWLATNLRGLAAGADAVAGRAVIDPEEAKLIPSALHEADARECAYAALIDEIASLLDPDPLDPWPRHDEANGASLAVRVATYRAVGGMPEVPLGEDRLFVRALLDHDLHVRHDPAVWVTVSGRTEGRAKGGMAETMRRRMSAPDLLLDDRLENADAAVRRARLRRTARFVHAGLIPPTLLAVDLDLPCDAIADALCGPFGLGWAKLETMAAVLRRFRMPVADLPVQTSAAARIRGMLLRSAQSNRDDTALAARA